MICITIEGLEGAWGFGDMASAPTGHIARPRALSAIPKGAQDSIDPVSYRVSAGRCAATVNASAQARLELLYQAPYGSALAQLQSAASASASPLDLGVSGLDNTVVYIGAETINLGADIGGGVYSVSRGVYGSSAREHEQGAYVYAAPPFFEGRGFTVWRAQASGWVELWRGYLDAPPRTTADLTQIQLQARSALDQARKKKINRTSRASLWSGYVCQQYNSTTHKPSSSWDNGIRACLIGGALLVVQRVGAGARVYPATRAQLGSDDLVLDTPQQGREVLLIDRELDALGLVTSPTAQLAYPYHPVSVAAALLFSDGASAEDVAAFNVLGGAWGAGLKTTSTRLAEIGALIERTAELEIDRLMVGSEGASAVVDVVDSLLAAWGFVLVQDAQGYLTIRRVEQLDIDAELAELQAVDAQAVWQAPDQSTSRQILIELGRLPWRAPTVVRLSARGVDADDSDSTSSAKIDLNSIKAERADSLARTSALSVLMLRQQGWPVLKIKCNATSLSLLDPVQPLSPIGLRTEVFLTSDQQLTSDLNQVQFAGLIIGLQRIYDSDSCEVTILLTQYPIRSLLKHRAPSAKVDSVSVDGLDITIAVDGGFGELDDDIKAWVGLDGIEVELADIDGAWVGGGVRTITNIDVINSIISIDSAFASTPTAGQYLRLARLPNMTQEPRIYAYIAGNELAVVDGDKYG